MIENNNGIYIHIPFCKKACHYCNFHFSVNTSMLNTMIEAITKEIFLRKDYLKKPVQSIYFGGGTPSLLDSKHINVILKEIYKYFIIEDDVEITFEVNPDDLSYKKPIGLGDSQALEKLKSLKNAGINRLSMGIQSFNNANLEYINRAHNAEQAIESFSLARELGFNNISIDLIYGIPNSSFDTWQKDVNTAVALKPEHISSYCLTIEKNTYFGKLHSEKKLAVKSSEEEIAMYDVLVKLLSQAGYIQYEVSNFCLIEGYDTNKTDLLSPDPDQLSKLKQCKYSKHNSNYWKKGCYLGLGPSAHSYNQTCRQWNVRSNKKYIDAITKGILPYELEVLSEKDHINEHIMTGLRTIWGCDIGYIRNKYDYNILEYSKKDIQMFIARGYLTLENDILRANAQGFKLIDEISSRLFVV